MLINGIFFIIFLTLIQFVNCDSLYEIDNKLTRNSVFFCNFDGNNTCGGTLFFNSSGILHSFSFQQNQIIINTTVTDVTSITKPTGTSTSGPFDGPACRIPWQQLTYTYYFCNPTYFCMPYQPENNVTRHCQRGRYIWGRTNTGGDRFFGELYIPSIDLGSQGLFEISYHLVMYCENETCISGQDSVKILISDQESDEVIATYTHDYSNTEYSQRRWTKHSFEFESLNATLINLRVQFQRLNKITPVVYFVFDEIEIVELLDEETEETQEMFSSETLSVDTSTAISSSTSMEITTSFMTTTLTTLTTQSTTNLDETATSAITTLQITSPTITTTPATTLLASFTSTQSNPSETSEIQTTYTPPTFTINPSASTSSVQPITSSSNAVTNTVTTSESSSKISIIISSASQTTHNSASSNAIGSTNSVVGSSSSVQTSSSSSLLPLSSNQGSTSSGASSVASQSSINAISSSKPSIQSTYPIGSSEPPAASITSQFSIDPSAVSTTNSISTSGQSAQTLPSSLMPLSSHAGSTQSNQPSSSSGDTYVSSTLTTSTSTTTTTTTKNDGETNEGSSGDLAVAIIVSGTVGILIGMGGTIAVGYFFWYRKLKKVIPADSANIEMK